MKKSIVLEYKSLFAFSKSPFFARGHTWRSGQAVSSLLSCWRQLSKVAKKGSSSCHGTFPGLTSFAFEYEIRRESTLVAHHSQPCPSPTYAPKKPHGDLHLAAQSVPNPHPSKAMALLWHNKWWYLSCLLSGTKIGLLVHGLLEPLMSSQR